MADTFLCIDDKEFDFKIIGNRKRKSKRHWGIISFEIPVEEVVDLPSNCKVMICYKTVLIKLFSVMPTILLRLAQCSSDSEALCFMIRKRILLQFSVSLYAIILMFM